MREQIIVFDLDDTLYEEMTFVRSGFRAVAAYIEAESGRIDANACYERMMQVLAERGRGRVFDTVLEELGIGSRRMAGRCLQVYRGHTPDIRLYDDAVHVLESLAGRRMHIVTDGNKLVQRSKLQALGLYDNPAIARCWITRRYGIRNEKPSPYCFERICKLEQAEPAQVVYIGDNPNKDFVGIKPLGFATIRIMRGAFQDLRLPESFEAAHQITSLRELPALLADMR